MKVTMIDAISLNGYITRGDDPHVEKWTSAEDSQHFRHMLALHDTIIMGRKTYLAANPKPDPSTLRIVITRQIENFAVYSVPGALEFTNAAPQTIIADLKARNRQSVMIAGGSEINRLFLLAGLVDDMYITIEPVLFGTGTNLIANGPFDAGCELISISQLNTRGTLLAHYSVSYID